jgi:hypothetical protein
MHTSQKEYRKAIRNKTTFDAIIVPGIPFTGANWSYLMKARVIWSWILYKNGLTKNVIYSGGAVHTPYQEALVMGLYAQKLGIPKENIFYDTCAQHSIENVYYSYLLAKQHEFRKVAIASDVYQCFFLHNLIRGKFYNKVAQLPVISDTIAGYRDMDLRIDPSSAIVHDLSRFIPLSEKESYFQRMRGTFGLNINWKLKNPGIQ